MSLAAVTTPIRLIVNGRTVEVSPDAQHATLLDLLRANGWTGAKEGCAEGECGACAVAVVAPHEGRSSFRVVNSCLLPATVAADQEIYTVESLATDGQLAPAQQAMAAAGGSQCGYCTPGMLMSATALLRDNPSPSEDEIKKALQGNICRCTGYWNIFEAVKAASQ